MDLLKHVHNRLVVRPSLIPCACFGCFFFVSILSLSRFFYYIISISLLYGLFCSWCFAQIERFFISTIQIEVICSSMAAFFGSLCSLKGEKFKWWLFFIAVILWTALGMWMAELNRKCFTNQVYTCLCVCSERPKQKQSVWLLAQVMASFERLSSAILKTESECWYDN